MFGRKRCICLYLHLKKLAPGGIWTHTVRGGRRCNHITRISPLAKYPKFGGVTAICRGSMTRKVLTRQLNGKKLESGGIWARARGIPWKHHYIMRNYVYTKYTKFHVATAEHRITDTEKVLKYTFTKTGTWWELNTHCSGGRRYNHITREHRITDTEKVLKYTFTKTGTWWELNTHWSGGRR